MSGAPDRPSKRRKLDDTVSVSGESSTRAARARAREEMRAREAMANEESGDEDEDEDADSESAPELVLETLPFIRPRPLGIHPSPFYFASKRMFLIHNPPTEPKIGDVSRRGGAGAGAARSEKEGEKGKVRERGRGRGKSRARSRGKSRARSVSAKERVGSGPAKRAATDMEVDVESDDDDGKVEVLLGVDNSRKSGSGSGSGREEENSDADDESTEGEGEGSVPVLRRSQRVARPSLKAGSVPPPATTSVSASASASASAVKTPGTGTETGTGRRKLAQSQEILQMVAKATTRGSGKENAGVGAGAGVSTGRSVKGSATPALSVAQTTRSAKGKQREIPLPTPEPMSTRGRGRSRQRAVEPPTAGTSAAGRSRSVRRGRSMTAGAASVEPVRGRSVRRGRSAQPARSQSVRRGRSTTAGAESVGPTRRSASTKRKAGPDPPKEKDREVSRPPTKRARRSMSVAPKTPGPQRTWLPRALRAAAREQLKVQIEEAERKARERESSSSPISSSRAVSVRGDEDIESPPMSPGSALDRCTPTDEEGGSRRGEVVADSEGLSSASEDERMSLSSRTRVANSLRTGDDDSVVVKSEEESGDERSGVESYRGVSISPRPGKPFFMAARSRWANPASLLQPHPFRPPSRPYIRASDRSDEDSDSAGGRAESYYAKSVRSISSRSRSRSRSIMPPYSESEDEKMAGVVPEAPMSRSCTPLSCRSGPSLATSRRSSPSRSDSARQPSVVSASPSTLSEKISQLPPHWNAPLSSSELSDVDPAPESISARTYTQSSAPSTRAPEDSDRESHSSLSSRFSSASPRVSPQPPLHPSSPHIPLYTIIINDTLPPEKPKPPPVRLSPRITRRASSLKMRLAEVENVSSASERVLRARTRGVSLSRASATSSSSRPSRGAQSPAGGRRLTAPPRRHSVRDTVVRSRPLRR
ncbi:hypothetical protein BOTBODRAFT_216974 [Botryobasidium botryosum FD-172 SS1]|uniref:Uncharacterized protein n=1 Tax=Botryobasidium botryosum (strain FD-172 SS1) TaxID=930990 RepID=A0A067NCS8_BOTB1|nr:hypothetical protein BOTBODRAFT_216974 [Botryobasidium botryosum FD-172 SS1]